MVPGHRVRGDLVRVRRTGDVHFPAVEFDGGLCAGRVGQCVVQSSERCVLVAVSLKRSFANSVRRDMVVQC